MKWRSQLLVKHIAPEDKAVLADNAGRLMTDQNGAGLSTASFLVLNQNVRSPYTVKPSTTLYTVENGSLFTVNDIVRVPLSNMTEGFATVDDIDGNDLTLSAHATPPAEIGTILQKVYKKSTGVHRVDMVMGGESPRSGMRDWWWQGLLEPSNYEFLIPGLEIEVETLVTKTAGGMRSLSSICDVVEDDCAPSN